jgi:hypothetical protein|tara:strand:- start:3817 stop:4326 length:510 start_codon:yes stop_codon:yes gene_type:complete
MADIVLCNGRGQLGDALRELNLKSNTSEKVYIYHTWNFLDKDRETQAKCYDKFVEFVEKHIAYEIVFISTYSEQNNPYTYYKQLAEAYLLTNSCRCKIVRLPILLGSGICTDLKSGNSVPYGSLELITPEDAAYQILNITNRPHNHNRVFRIRGENISAKLATRLLTFK